MTPLTAEEIIKSQKPKAKVPEYDLLLTAPQNLREKRKIALELPAGI